MVNDVTLYRSPPIDSSQLNQNQRDSVAYFFFRLKTTDPTEYDRVIPDESTERALKAEYAPHVMNMTRTRIDAGIALWHQYRQSRDYANRDYQFLKIDNVIGLIYEANNPRPEHKILPIGLPEPPGAKRERKQRLGNVVGDIKKLFDE